MDHENREKIKKTASKPRKPRANQENREQTKKTAQNRVDTAKIAKTAKKTAATTSASQKILDVREGKCSLMAELNSYKFIDSILPTITSFWDTMIRTRRVAEEGSELL